MCVCVCVCARACVCVCVREREIFASPSIILTIASTRHASKLYGTEKFYMVYTCVMKCDCHLERLAERTQINSCAHAHHYITMCRCAMSASGEMVNI